MHEILRCLLRSKIPLANIPLAFCIGNDETAA